MFSSGPNYNKLKTNLRLALNRLKLLEKKKTELALKARKEIADYISINKAERAKIRVEHIIREDYLVEAMEIVECYCDLLLARMGLIQQMKTLDDGLAEPISSIIWAAPRMEADIPELRIISDQFGFKYGKEYILACRENSLETVSPTLMHKLGVQAPPKVLVEKYLIEIARNFGIPYEPDSSIMTDDLGPGGYLINFNDSNKNDGPGGSGASGGGGGSSESCSQCSAVGPQQPDKAGAPPIGFVYPDTLKAQGGAYNQPVAPSQGQEYNPYTVKTQELKNTVSQQPPAPRNKLDTINLPDVPNIPSGLPQVPSVSNEEEVNFDDLTRRFEALKKQK